MQPSGSEFESRKGAVFSTYVRTSGDFIRGSDEPTTLTEVIGRGSTLGKTDSSVDSSVTMNGEEFKN